MGFLHSSGGTGTSDGLLVLYASILGTALYVFGVCFYRLFLSSARHIPGPFLAKLTYLYEFYYDVSCGGQYVWKIREMHQKYGPIVRINPEEVHVADADFYDEIYAGAGRKRDKWTFFTSASGVEGSAFGTVNHDLHRMRRAALNPYFSKAQVRNLQPRIEEVLDNLMRRFDEFGRTQAPMPISLAYAALTNDVVMEYAFARSEKRVEAPDFDPSFKEAGEIAARIGHFIKQVPWTLKLMRILPDSFQTFSHPEMASYIKLNKDVIAHVTRVHAQRNNPDFIGKTQKTIFHELLNSSLPESEKAVSRLWQDGQVTIIAGTLTTAAALAEITFHLLQSPTVLNKLKSELSAAIPDPLNMPPIAKLEQLPYLTAIIKEGLRISNGISTRLQRIATNETLIFNAKLPYGLGGGTKQYVLEPGIPLSMTGMLVHMDPQYFPNPGKFIPERWLENPGLDKYLVAFSRGTRQCIGINLAYAEIYLVLAKVFAQYGSKEVQFPKDRGCLELYRTTRHDLEIIGDGVTPLYHSDSNGVRILVHQ